METNTEQELIQKAWTEDTDEADEILAMHFAGHRADAELPGLNEAQVRRLAELYCGPIGDMDSLVWLEKAAQSNGFARSLLMNIDPSRVPAAAAPIQPDNKTMIMPVEQGTPEETKKKNKKEKKQKKEKTAKVKTEKPKKKKKGWLIALFIILLLLIAAAAGAYWWFFLKTVEVDPTEYITVSVDGLNGYASAKAELNLNDLREASKREIPEDAIGLTIVGNEDLANGDEVVVNVEVDEEKAKAAHVAFTNTEYHYSVDGLSEPELVDPFTDLNVIFTGEDGSGTALVVSVSEDPFLSSITYVCEPDSGLSTGDVIMVTAVVDKEKMKEYGKAPEYTQKEATVVSLNKYVADRSEMTDQGYGDLFDKGYSYIRSTLLNDTDKYSAAAGGRNLTNAMILDAWMGSMYIITPTEASESSSSFKNRIVMIYHVSSRDSGKDNRYFYIPVVYDNVMMGDNGVISYEDRSDNTQVWKHTANDMNSIYNSFVSQFEKDYTIKGTVME